ncbi:MAG: hypothetical protein CMJ64_00450 [Planctomycetaceae bacterium]|nr:hypothetical protein [Planctomycetaceae bacterium]
MNAILTRRKFTNSITSKLTLLMAFASGLALLISCTAFVFNDIVMLRQSKVRELTSVAEVIASNSTAVLAFGQGAPAEELLASLSDRRDITTARLFDVDEAFFAGYSADGIDESEANLAAPETMGHSFSESGILQVALPVFDQAEHLGYVQLRATTGDLHGQTHRSIDTSPLPPV